MRRASLSKAASLILTAGLCQALWAQDGLEEIPEAAPPPPAAIEDGQSIEGGTSLEEDESLAPDVTIVQRKDALTATSATHTICSATSTPPLTATSDVSRSRGSVGIAPLSVALTQIWAMH